MTISADRAKELEVGDSLTTKDGHKFEIEE